MPLGNEEKQTPPVQPGFTPQYSKQYLTPEQMEQYNKYKNVVDINSSVELNNPAYLNERAAAAQSALSRLKNAASYGLLNTANQTIGGVMSLPKFIEYLPQAIQTGEFSKLYDNDYFRSIDEKSNSLAKEYENFYSEKREKDNVFEHLTTQKFWFDEVAQGASFLAGAALTEIAYETPGLLLAPFTGGASEAAAASASAAHMSKVLRALSKFGKVMNYADDAASVAGKSLKLADAVGDATRIARQTITGAGYESGIEASSYLNQTRDKLTELRQKNIISEEEYQKALDETVNTANVIFGANLVTVGASNMMQFPQIFGLGSKGLAKLVNKSNILESAAKYDKNLYKALRTVKNPMSEATEEMLQSFYTKTGEDYILSRYDKANYDEALNFIGAGVNALGETLGSKEAWSQGANAFLMGAIGMPNVTGIYNRVVKKKKNSDLLSGGLYGEYQEFKEEKEKVQSAIADYKANTTPNILTFAKHNLNNLSTAIRSSRRADAALAMNDIFNAKNERNTSVTSLMINRIKLGLHHELDNLSEQIEKMSDESFNDTFYNSELSAEQIKDEKKKVVDQFKEKTQQVKDAYSQASTLLNGQSDDLIDAMAFNISRAHEVRNRLSSISQEVFSELGIMNPKSIKEVTDLMEEIDSITDIIKSKPKNQKRYREKYINRRNELIEKLNKTDLSLHENLKNQLKDIVEYDDETQTFRPKAIADAENSMAISQYNNILERIIAKLPKTQMEIESIVDQIHRSLSELRTEDPNKLNQLESKVSDYIKLQSLQKQVIDEYNKLITKEGQQELQRKIDKKKEALVSEKGEEEKAPMEKPKSAEELLKQASDVSQLSAQEIEELITQHKDLEFSPDNVQDAEDLKRSLQLSLARKAVEQEPLTDDSREDEKLFNGITVENLALRLSSVPANKAYDNALFNSVLPTGTENIFFKFKTIDGKKSVSFLTKINNETVFLGFIIVSEELPEWMNSVTRFTNQQKLDAIKERNRVLEELTKDKTEGQGYPVQGRYLSNSIFYNILGQHEDVNYTPPYLHSVIGKNKIQITSSPEFVVDQNSRIYVRLTNSDRIVYVTAKDKDGNEKTFELNQNNFSKDNIKLIFQFVNDKILTKNDSEYTDKVLSEFHSRLFMINQFSPDDFVLQPVVLKENLLSEAQDEIQKRAEEFRNDVFEISELFRQFDTVSETERPDLQKRVSELVKNFNNKLNSRVNKNFIGQGYKIKLSVQNSRNKTDKIPNLKISVFQGNKEVPGTAYITSWKQTAMIFGSHKATKQNQDEWIADNRSAINDYMKQNNIEDSEFGKTAAMLFKNSISNEIHQDVKTKQAYVNFHMIAHIANNSIKRTYSDVKEDIFEFFTYLLEPKDIYPNKENSFIVSKLFRNNAFIPNKTQASTAKPAESTYVKSEKSKIHFSKKEIENIDFNFADGLKRNLSLTAMDVRFTPMKLNDEYLKILEDFYKNNKGQSIEVLNKPTASSSQEENKSTKEESQKQLVAGKSITEFTPEEQKTSPNENIEQKIKTLQQNKKFIKLSPDGKTYVNTKTGKIYQRVTSVVKGKDFDDSNELVSTAIEIGNKVDIIFRDFFAGKLKTNKEYKISSNEIFNSFVEQLKEFKRNLDAIGIKIYSEDIVVYNDELGVAGTIDLFGINESTGEIIIFDIKSKRRGVQFIDSTKFGKSDREVLQDQLSMYNILLNNTNQLKANTLVIIPVKVDYEPKDSQTKELNILPTISLSVKEEEELPLKNDDSENDDIFESLAPSSLELDSDKDNPSADFSINSEDTDTVRSEEEIEKLREVIPDTMISNKKLDTVLNNFSVSSEYVQGLFYKGLVWIKDGMVRKGTGYHEAWHAVFNMFLTRRERRLALRYAEKEFRSPNLAKFRFDNPQLQNLNDKQLLKVYYDEQLAEKYREHRLSQSKVPSFLSSIFNAIAEFVKTFSLSSALMILKFDEISRGKYRNALALREAPSYSLNSTLVSLTKIDDKDRPTVVSSVRTEQIVNRGVQIAFDIQEKNPEMTISEVLNKTIDELADYYNPMTNKILGSAVRSMRSSGKSDVQSVVETIMNFSNVFVKEVNGVVNPNYKTNVNVIKDRIFDSLSFFDYIEDDENDRDEESFESEESLQTSAREKGTISKEMKKWFAFARLEGENEFGIPKEVGFVKELSRPVSIGVAYEGILRNLVDIEQSKFLSRIHYMSQDNPNIKAVWDLMQKSFQGKTHEELLKEENMLYQKFLTGFTKSRQNSFIAMYDTNTGLGSFINANSNGVEAVQLNKLKVAFNSNNIHSKLVEMSKNISAFSKSKDPIDKHLYLMKKQLEYISSEMKLDPSKVYDKAQNEQYITDLSNALQSYGISLSRKYIKNSIIQFINLVDTSLKYQLDDSSLTSIKGFLYLLYEGEEQSNQFQLFEATNPYNQEGVSGKEISTRLKYIAQENALFQEGIGRSSFRNGEGKTIYEMLDHNLMTKQIQSLKSINVEEIFNQFADLKTREKAIDDFAVAFNLVNRQDARRALEWLYDNKENYAAQLSKGFKVSLMDSLKNTELEEVSFEDFEDNQDNAEPTSVIKSAARKSLNQTFGKSFTKLSGADNLLARMIMYISPFEKNKGYRFYNPFVAAGKSMQAIVELRTYGVDGDTNHLLQQTKTGVGESTDFLVSQFALPSLRQEYNRIIRVKQSLSDPTEDKIEQYNNYPDARGTTYFVNRAFINYLEKNHIEEYNRLVVSQEFDEERLSELLKEFSDQRYQKFLNYLEELNIITKDEKGNYSSTILPTGRSTDETSSFLYKNSNFVNHQVLAEFFFNDYYNSKFFQDMTIYDPTIGHKSLVELNKRAGGVNGMGAFSSINRPIKSITLKSVERPVLDNKKADVTDAQSYGTTRFYIQYYLKALTGKLNEEKLASIYKKLQRGFRLNSEEEKILSKLNAQVTPRKLLYRDPVQYVKTSTKFLTRTEVSIIKPDTNIDQLNALADQVDELYMRLFNGDESVRQEFIEKQKQLHDYYLPVPHLKDKHNLLNHMELHDIDFAAFTSATKLKRVNVLDYNPEAKNYYANYPDKFVLYHPKFLLEQQATDGVKEKTPDGVQKIGLVSQEQDPKLVHKLNGINFTSEELSRLYRTMLAQRTRQGFEEKKKEVINEKGEVYLGDLLENFKESLIASNSDELTRELFDSIEGEPKYDLNMVMIEQKFQSMFLSWLSKNTLSHKRAGSKYTLAAVNFKETYEVATGKYIRMSEIRKDPMKYMDENGNLKKEYAQRDLQHNVQDGELLVSHVVIPQHLAVAKGLKPGDEIPKALAYQLGVRIPTQDKHSMGVFKVIDVLPEFTGNVIYIPSEIQILSGADFDVDGEFNSQYAVYRHGKKLYRYGDYAKLSDINLAYTELLNLNFDKTVDKKISKDPEFIELNNKIKNLQAKIKQDRKEYLEATAELENLKEEYIFQQNESLEQVGNMSLVSEEFVNYYQDTADELEGIIENYKLSKDDINEVKELKKQLKQFRDKVYKLEGLSKEDFEQSEDYKKYQGNIEKWKNKKYSPLNKYEADNFLLDMELRLAVNEGNKEIANTSSNMDLPQELARKFLKLKVLNKLNQGESLRIYIDKATQKASINQFANSEKYVFDVSGNDILENPNSEEAQIFELYMNYIMKEKAYIDIEDVYGADSKTKAYDSVGVGQTGIGVMALNNILIQTLTNAGLLDHIKNIHDKNQYKGLFVNTGTYNFRINEFVSSFLSAYTDNDKEQLAAVLGLNMDLLGAFVAAVTNEYDPYLFLLLMNMDSVKSQLHELQNAGSVTGGDESKSSLNKKFEEAISMEEIKKLTPEKHLTEKLERYFVSGNATETDINELDNIAGETFKAYKKLAHKYQIMTTLISLVKGFDATIPEMKQRLESLEELGVTIKNNEFLAIDPEDKFASEYVIPLIENNPQLREQILVAKETYDKVLPKFFIVNTKIINQIHDKLASMINYNFLNNASNLRRYILSAVQMRLLANSTSALPLDNALMFNENNHKLYDALLERFKNNPLLAHIEKKKTDMKKSKNSPVFKTIYYFTTDTLLIKDNWVDTDSQAEFERIINIKVDKEKLKKSLNITDDDLRMNKIVETMNKFKDNKDLNNYALNLFGKVLKELGQTKDNLQFRSGAITKRISPKQFQTLAQKLKTLHERLQKENSPTALVNDQQTFMGDDIYEIASTLLNNFVFDVGVQKQMTLRSFDDFTNKDKEKFKELTNSSVVEQYPVDVQKDEEGKLITSVIFDLNAGIDVNDEQQFKTVRSFNHKQLQKFGLKKNEAGNQYEFPFFIRVRINKKAMLLKLKTVKDKDNNIYQNLTEYEYLFTNNNHGVYAEYEPMVNYKTITTSIRPGYYSWDKDLKPFLEKYYGDKSDTDEKRDIAEERENPRTPEFNKLPKRSDVRTMTYAGIGSRQTPREILEQMTEVAKELELKHGYTLNTGITFDGREEGADAAFSRGASKKNLFSPEKHGSRKREQEIAMEIHPNPGALTKVENGIKKDGALKLMARNTNQIFGENLDTPVDFVLFYAKETNSIRPEGGTGQAVEMARLKGIPTVNMSDPNWKDQLKKILETQQVSPSQKSISDPTSLRMSDVINSNSLLKLLSDNIHNVSSKNSAKELFDELVKRIRILASKMPDQLSNERTEREVLEPLIEYYTSSNPSSEQLTEKFGELYTKFCQS